MHIHIYCILYIIYNFMYIIYNYIIYINIYIYMHIHICNLQAGKNLSIENIDSPNYKVGKPWGQNSILAQKQCMNATAAY